MGRFARNICLFSISLLQQEAAGQQQSGRSPIGIFWLPAGNSWSLLLLPVDLGPAGGDGIHPPTQSARPSAHRKNTNKRRGSSLSALGNDTSLNQDSHRK
ncbi:unnamed protein product [Pleuronectes platessa]|uniref:Secreted protein n=1 Tax=Pleuronectes platessa TaxID=8262 RepID=A0A9N7YXC5_PLEPL|nr:unnamed protein product [Pleuronectes platessa]